MTILIAQQNPLVQTKYLNLALANTKNTINSTKEEENKFSAPSRTSLSAADISNKNKELFSQNALDTTKINSDKTPPSSNARVPELTRCIFSIYESEESKKNDELVLQRTKADDYKKLINSTSKGEIINVNSPPLSDKEIADLIAAAMSEIKDEYLEPFLNAFDKIQEFNELMSKYKNLFTNMFIVKDEDELRFDVGDLNDILNELEKEIQAYKGEKSELIGGLSTEEEAKGWCEKFGTGKVIKKSDGTWSVQMDSSPLEKLLESIVTCVDAQKKTDPNGGEYWGVPFPTIYLHMFNTANSAINATYESVNTIANLFSNKLSNANSTYQRVTEILSSFIAQSLQTSQQFMRI